MDRKLWIDLETYCEVPIKFGTYVYARAAEITLISYAIDDAPPECIDLTDPSHWLCDELAEAMADPNCEVWAQNSQFDRTVLSHFKGLPQVPIERWRDTMVQAYCHALPGSLDKLCDVLAVPQEVAKLKDGRSLVMLFCKPRPKNTKIRRATRETHPEQWARFIEYAKADITSMRECHKRMPKFNYPTGASGELHHWHLDQKINDRGFCVDLDLVRGAIEAVADEKEVLKQQAQEITNGEVTNATRRDQVLHHILEQYGIVLEDLKKGNIERVLDNPDMPRGVKELLAIRLQATTTSTAKYTALLNATNADGRCRGTIQFGGAARTLRASGRVFQPQNLPSRGLLEDYEIDFGIDAVKSGAAHEFFPNVMKLLSSCVRGVLVASPGSKLVVADLSNIEGRLAAWLAGEAWKLDAFRAFDSGTGHDLYNLAYAKAFKIDVTAVKKPQRAIGKVMELMLGYGGGVGAFVTGALGYGFDIQKLAEDNWGTFPQEQMSESNKFYAYVMKKKTNTFGLSKEGFMACDILKRLWRESNPMISGMWGVLENAITLAITNPGAVYDVGQHIKVRRDTNWLRVRLPSGRYLCYANPRLDEKGGISYMGLNNYTRQWTRLKGYGGLFLENCCQAIARDVLYSSMPKAEAEGYRVVLHVHDELVTEAPDTKLFTDVKLAGILSSEIEWAAGLPLAAAGFESYRYKK